MFLMELSLLIKNLNLKIYNIKEKSRGVYRMFLFML